MRKILLAVLFISCFVSDAAWAQVQVYAGPRVGLSFSKFALSDGNEESMKSIRDFQDALPALHYGVVGQFEFSDAFSLQPEILYSRKGSKNYRLSSINYTAIRNYLEIPVLAKLSFGSPNTKFFLNAGPYAAFMLNGKTKTVARGINGPSEETEEVSFDYAFQYPGYETDNRSKLSRFDYGVLLGAGVALQVGTGKLLFEGRYDKGLKDLFIYEKQRTAGVPKYTNSTWASSVTYLIPIGL